MNENLLKRILMYLEKKLRERRWRRAVTCLAAVIVFAATYVLILPAITMTHGHPSVSAEKTEAESGEELSLRVTAEAPVGESERVVILTAEGDGADLSSSYVFDNEGVCEITDDEGRTVELHRSRRELDTKDASGEKKYAVDYWFILASGAQTSFTLDLVDEVSNRSFAKIIETVKETAAESAPAEEIAVAAEGTATASDAVKSGDNATSSNANRASASDAAKAAAEANAIATNEDEITLTEENDDGFVELLDGKIVNDVNAGEDDSDEASEISARLKLAAGMGTSYDAAVKDIARNADKRGDAVVQFTWTKPEEQAVRSELVTRVGDAVIAVICPEDTELPAGAYIDAYEITPDSIDYQQYVDQAGSAVADNAGVQKRVTRARFFDITIRDAEGNEIQPDGQVKVVISYDKADVAENGEGLNVVHFDEGAANLVETEAEESDAVAFGADSFSVYGVVYTVDFEYELNGTTFTYKLDGGKSISLKSLIAKAGVLEAAKAAEFVETQVESVSFSNEELVKVTREGNDWVLESLESFTSPETLTVSLKDGRTVTVKVTDPPAGPHASTSSNLRDFLTAVSIQAPTNEEGHYVVEPDTSYSINLSFKERNNRLQFDNDTLTYRIPDGLNADGHEGTFTVKINRDGQTYSVAGNTFSVNNGTLTVHWNKDDPNYRQLTASGNVGFTITLEGTFSEDADKIRFSDEIVKDVDINTSSSVKTSKSAYVDKVNDKINYTATVTSEGTSRNVVITDTITGNGLSLNPESITASSSTGQSVSMTGGASGNTFTYTIPSMSNGEIITFNYSADINPAVLELINGKVVTQSGNTFKATSDGDPEGDKTNVNNTIDYTPGISKSNATITGTDGTVTTLSWSLVVNPDAKVSAAGVKVTDTIGSASQSIMKYSGEGITVKVTDAAGNPIRTDNVSWSSLDGKTDSAWTYTIPDGDKGHAYNYTIEYTTDVETKDLQKLTNVENTGTTDGGGSSTGTGTVGPDTPDVEIRKKAAKIDRANKEVTWTVTFTVPKNGFDKAVVTDYYPNQWIGNEQVYEKVKEGTVSVTGLVAGEQWDVEYGDTAAFITFSKDGAPGLKATESNRVVTVALKTEISDKWVEASKVENWRVDHQNRVTLDYGGNVEANATAKNTANTIKKTSMAAESRTVDNIELPVYKYEVTLTGVESDSFTITDTFDTEILEPYNTGEDAFYIYGGDQYYQGIKGDSPATYINTVNGMTITVTSDSLPKDSSSPTGYYAGYKLVYYLTVKNQTALAKLMQRSASSEDGQAKIENTVDWEGVTDTTTVVYQYNGLDKEILTSDEELKKTDEDIYAWFKITLNPAGLMLNGGEPLTMTDTINNLSIDIPTITVQEPQNSGITYDMTGNTVTFTIPDAVKVVIRYRARVLFAEKPEIGKTGTVTFSNEAVMEGFRDRVEKTAELKNDGQGSGDVNNIRLMKYEAGNMTKRLRGAVFELLDSDKNPVVDSDGNEVVFTTDDSGMIRVEGDQERDGWSIAEGEKYYLRETVAPEGYMLADFDYEFTISSDGTTDYSKYIYHSGDTMSAKNYPGTDVKVEKVWSDGNDKHESDAVTVKLQQRIGGGEWSDIIRAEVIQEDGTYAWADTPERSMRLGEGNGWKYTFSSLPIVVPEGENFDGDDVSVEYRVVESMINGTDVTVSEDDQYTGNEEIHIVPKGDGQFSYTINNIVAGKGGIKLHKRDANNPTRSLAGAEFEMYRCEVADDGRIVSSEKTGGTYTSDSSGIVSFNDLDYYTLYYWIETKAPENYSIGTGGEPHYFIVYEATEEGKDRARKLDGRVSEANRITVNVLDGEYAWTVLNGKSVTVEKLWTDKDGNSIVTDDGTVSVDGREVESITVKLQQTLVMEGMEANWSDYRAADGSDVTLVLNAGNRWKGGFDNLPLTITDAAGLEIPVAYRVVEWKIKFKDSAEEKELRDFDQQYGQEGADAGEWIINAWVVADDGSSFKLRNRVGNLDISAKVVKVWDDNNNADNLRPTSITVQLMQQSGNNPPAAYGDPVVLSALDWSATVDGLPTEDADGNKYSYTWVEVEGDWSEYYVLTDTETGESDVIRGTVTTLTNTEVTKVPVKKEWVHADGTTTWPDGVFVQVFLYQTDEDGTPVQVTQVVAGEERPVGVILSAENPEHTFENLPRYINGREVEYSVVEEPVPGYKSIITTDQYTGLVTITNEQKYVTGELKALKKLTGRTWKTNDRFEFTVNPMDGAPAFAKNAVTITKDSENFTESFGTVTFTKEGTYKYTVSETAGSDSSITYDSEDKIIEFVVRENSNGDLVIAEEDKTVQTAEFTNIYEAEGEIVLSGEKELIGRELEEGEFTFELLNADGSVRQAVTNDANGSYSFDAIKYKLDDLNKDRNGDYLSTEIKYQVREVPPQNPEPGITYDENIYDVTVTLKDKGDGTIEVTADPASGTYKFTNTYTASGKAKIYAVKEVTGAAWPEGATATFTLTAETEGAPVPEVTKITLWEAGTADFGDITYLKEDAGKTYVYTITETPSGFGDGWTSTGTVKAKVVVGEDKGDGTLGECVVTYEPEGAKIINTYKAPGSLKITKTVEGGITKEEAEGGLAFVVQKLDGEGNVIGYLDKEGNLVNEETKLTISDFDSTVIAEDGSLLSAEKEFKNIEYGTYKVIETNTEIEGYRFEKEQSVTESGTITVSSMAETPEAELKDVYTQLGKLDITKTVIGGITKEEAEGALKFEITTTVKVIDEATGEEKEVTKWLDAEGNLADEKAELTIADFDEVNTDEDGHITSAVKHFEGIETGTYKVVETNSTIEGYRFEETQSVTEAETTVTKDTAGAAEIIDVYTELGDLEITKTVSGGITKEEAEGALTFEITTTVKVIDETTGEATEVTKWLAADGSLSETQVVLTIADFDEDTFEYDSEGNLTKAVKKFEGIEAGIYKVVETNSEIEGYRFEAEHSVTEAETTVTKDEAGAAEIIDAYTELGELEITKTVSSGITKEEAEGALTFEITTTVKEIDETTSEATEVTKWLAADGSLSETQVVLTIADFDEDTFEYDSEGNLTKAVKKFEGIEAGIYKVVETNSEIEGYRFEETQSVTEAETTVTKDKAVTAEIIDAYTELGKLDITKTVSGGITKEEAEGALKFEITTTVKVIDKETGEEKEVTKWLDKDGNLSDEKVELTIADFDEINTDQDGNITSAVKHFEDIEAGTYKVVETNSAIEGYRFEETQSVTEAETTVTKDTAGAAEIVDVYTELIDFSFYKTWHNAVSEIVAWDKNVDSIEVTVGRKKGTEEDGTFSYTYTVPRTAFTEEGTEIEAGNAEAGTEAPKLIAKLMPSKTAADGTPLYLMEMHDLEPDDGNGGTYTYFAKEKKVDGYSDPTYGTSDSDGCAYNDGQIINKPEDSIQLPESGGPGTLLYTLGGVMLLLCTALLYGFRLRRGERRLR